MDINMLVLIVTIVVFVLALNVKQIANYTHQLIKKVFGSSSSKVESSLVDVLTKFAEELKKESVNGDTSITTNTQIETKLREFLEAK